MRIVFMGTPDFAATILEDLAQHYDVVAAYTRPDAVRGRGKQLVASPVKSMAEGLGIPVFQPASLKDEQTVAELEALSPDFIVVAAYGMILPQAVLDIPVFDCLNVHASLLPRWRGAAPIEHAILAGDRETGVCIMRMEAGLDTGAYCVCRSLEIGDKRLPELADELANLGSQALLSAMVHIAKKQARWQVQDEMQATYASKIGKGELNLDPALDALTNVRRVRASGAGHPSKCELLGKGVTIIDAAELSPADIEEGLGADLEAGAVRFQGKRLFFGCNDKAMEIFTIKPDGKREMDVASYAAGAAALHGHEGKWASYHA